MEFKKNGWGTWLSSVSLCLLLIACGSSRQTTNDDAVDMDDLIGDEQEVSTGASDEEEVLRLLGITPAEESPKMMPVQQTQQPDVAANQMEDDLMHLKDQLSERDREIAALRDQLTEKEQEMTRARQTRTQQQFSPGMGGQPSSAFQAQYNQALALFRQHNYQGALSSFQQLLTYPTNSLTDNCQYWIGECYYALLNYNTALAEFDKVLGLANSNKYDDAQIMQGMCYLKLGDRAQARLVFQQLVSNYPESEYRSVAQRYLRELQ